MQFKYDDPYSRLTREVYPNGRYTEFSYDSTNRLSTVKDPFGFINALGYDAKERLGSLKHSTLGEADFTYSNSNDLLTTLTLGNGAYTNYAYDSLNRLTSFDLRQSNKTRILMHSWSYDNLGRKDASAGITASDGLGCWNPTKLDFTYDPASRVTEEKLKNGASTLWDVTYAYDKSGNRTAVNDGTINKTLGYGAANREASVSGGGTELSYDYKGNVTVRPPLAGGNAYNYTWDAYDRMTQVARTGQGTVNYKYDALGRLLMRNEASTTVTLNYWLGLSPLATEQSISAVSVFRPWVEAHTGPTSDGWAVASGDSGHGTAAYYTDASRGKVLHLSTSDSGNLDGKLIVGDQHSSNLNSNGTDWGKTDRGYLGLWIKNANSSHAFQMTFYLRIAGSNWTGIFNSGTGTFSTNFTSTYTYYLGSNGYSTMNDGNWHYVEIPLGSATVDGILVEGKDLYFDDPGLSGGVLKRSYSVVPGAEIESALGSWTGPSVAADNGNRTRYFQYNDLGSVMTQTKSDGNVEGGWEPDFSGNYEGRYSLSGSPVRPELGLTGKNFDQSAGLYYFGKRWQDSERRSFASVSRLQKYFESEYGFLENRTNLMYDPSGRNPMFGYQPDPMKKTGRGGMGGANNSGPCAAQGDYWITYAQANFGGDMDKCVGDCLKNEIDDQNRRLHTIVNGGIYQGVCASIGAGLKTVLPKILSKLGAEAGAEGGAEVGMAGGPMGSAGGALIGAAVGWIGGNVASILWGAATDNIAVCGDKCRQVDCFALFVFGIQIPSK